MRACRLRSGLAGIVMAGILIIGGIVSDFSAAEVQAARRTSYSVTQDDIDAALPGIICWGDSLTEGYLGDGVTYPDVLAALIDQRLIEPIRQASGNSSLTAPEVLNLGVSGQRTTEIAGRSGGVPFVITEDFTIPAGCTEVDISYASSDGLQETRILIGGDGGVETVTICGVEGELIRWYDTEADYSRYRFRRLEAGEAVYVPAGSYMYTNLYEEYLDYIPIVMMGNNGGWETNAQLAWQCLSMVSRYQSGQYIVAANPLNLETDAASMDALDDYMVSVFGENAVSLRKWMIENGLSKLAEYAGTEVSVSDADAARIAAGLIPSSLMNEDQVHFTSAGYVLVAEMFYEKLDTLGYFDALKALAGQ